MVDILIMNIKIYLVKDALHMSQTLIRGLGQKVIQRNVMLSATVSLDNTLCFKIQHFQVYYTK